MYFMVSSFNTSCKNKRVNEWKEMKRKEDNKVQLSTVIFPYIVVLIAIAPNLKLFHVCAMDI